jgi:hypothetical protein
MALLTRSQILAAKLPHQDVDIPEWGGSVRIQQMSVDTRVKFLETIRVYNDAVFQWEANELLDAKDKARKKIVKPEHVDTPALAIVTCLVDDSGNRMFTDKETTELNKLSFVSVRNLYAAVLDLNDFNKSTSAQVETEKKD